MAANVDSSDACPAAANPRPICRSSQVISRSTTFCWWYSGLNSSRCSQDRASPADGSSGGSAGAGRARSSAITTR